MMQTSRTIISRKDRTIENLSTQVDVLQKQITSTNDMLEKSRKEFLAD